MTGVVHGGGAADQDVPARQASVAIRRVAHKITSVGDRGRSSRHPFAASPSLGLPSVTRWTAGGRPTSSDRLRPRARFQGGQEWPASRPAPSSSGSWTPWPRTRRPTRSYATCSTGPSAACACSRRRC
jgi:hypothetical protein